MIVFLVNLITQTKICFFIQTKPLKYGYLCNFYAV